MGFTLAELLEGMEVKKTRAPAQATYQHPESPAHTWVGQGTQTPVVQRSDCRREDPGRPFSLITIC